MIQKCLVRNTFILKFFLNIIKYHDDYMYITRELIFVIRCLEEDLWEKKEKWRRECRVECDGLFGGKKVHLKRD